MTEVVALTKTELTELESTVKRGLASFIEVGQALQTIRERNGFRVRGFDSFHDYCEATFGFSERNGYRLIAAAETAQKVKAAAGVAPRNEFSARVLSKIVHDPKLIGKVKEKLAKSGQTIATATAEVIADVVDKVMPKTQPMFEEKPKARPIPGLSDACPNCGAVPDRYVHAEAGWQCGACNAPVQVGVLAAQVVICNECGAVITTQNGFCQNCGVAVE